jgi:uncharacterized protein YjiS (DUF1127 family)
MSNYDITTCSTSIPEIKSIKKAVQTSLSLAPVVQAIKCWYQAYSRRQLLVQLLRYDDHMLDDMGYARADLQAIAKLPLSTDAHQVLKELGQQRKLPAPRR